MKNFGLADLAIVAPHAPTWSEVTSAVRATDVLEGARIFTTLDEAIADRTLVVGTLDRTRIGEKQTLFTPLDLSRDPQLASERLALVFGSEKHGLINEDLSRCHRLMSIPTQPGCPSMNLGQAVAVCCYELVREPAQQGIETRLPEQATARAVSIALGLSLEILRRIDFILPGNEDDLTRRLRATFMRFGMRHYDVEMLCGILNRIKRELEETTGRK